MRVVAITADTSLTVTLAMMDDWEVVSAHDVDQAAEAAPFAAVGLVGVGQTEEGLEIVEKLHTRGVGIPFVVVGDRPAPFGSRALVLTRPFSLDDLRHAVDQAIATDAARTAPADAADAVAGPEAVTVEVVETVEESVETVVTLEEHEAPAHEPAAAEQSQVVQEADVREEGAEAPDLQAPFVAANGSERAPLADLGALGDLSGGLAAFEAEEHAETVEVDGEPAEPEMPSIEGEPAFEAEPEMPPIQGEPALEGEPSAHGAPDLPPPPLDDLPPPPLDELLSVSLHGPAGEREDESPPSPPLDDEPAVPSLEPDVIVLDEPSASEEPVEPAASDEPAEPASEEPAEPAASEEPSEPAASEEPSEGALVVEEAQPRSERSDDDRVLRRNAPVKATTGGIEATLIERLRGAYAAVAELEALVEELPVLGDPASLAAGFLDEITRVFSPDTAIVAERVRDTYRVVAASGLSAVERELPMRADQVLLADADRTEQALLVHPVALSSDLVEGINGVCTEALMCAPIAVDGRTVGIAIVGKDQIEEFELSKLAGLAREAAPFVAIAQLLWRLRHPA